MLSRNFRLQNVGDLIWLKKNYNFSKVSYSIDELVVLDVTRRNRNLEQFCEALKLLTDGCFVPISAGGGIDEVRSARKLLRSGADKVVVNTKLYSGDGFIENLASEFGQQCVVGSIDVKSSPIGGYHLMSDNGVKLQSGLANEWIEKVIGESIGEIYINSVDRDGTGQGLDLGILDLLPAKVSKPVILAGGAGNSQHLLEGFRDSRVDAVATANLFNFVGDGLKQARQSLVNDGIVLPMWSSEFFEEKLKAQEIKGDALD